MIYDSKCVPHKGRALSPQLEQDGSCTLSLAHTHWQQQQQQQSKDNYEPHLLGMLVYCQSRVNTNQLRHCQRAEQRMGGTEQQRERESESGRGTEREC